jgi:hypothetical protein
MFVKDEVEEQIGLQGGVRTVLEVLSSYISKQNIVVQVVGALWNLSNNANNKGLISHYNGVRLIAVVMKSYAKDAYIQKATCAALQNLAMSCKPEKKLLKFNA